MGKSYCSCSFAAVSCAAEIWEGTSVVEGDGLDERFGEVRNGKDQGNQDEAALVGVLRVLGFSVGDDGDGVAGPRVEIVESEPDEVGRCWSIASVSMGTTRKALGKRILVVFAGTKRVGLAGRGGLFQFATGVQVGDMDLLRSWAGC